MITIAVNPKEQFEYFLDKGLKKKYKGVQKDTAGIKFEANAGKVMDLKEYTDDYKKPKKLIQRRFQIKNTMQMVTIKKSQFAVLNDKRYFFYISICVHYTTKTKKSRRSGGAKIYKGCLGLIN